MKIADLIEVPPVRTVIRLDDAGSEDLSREVVRSFVPTTEAVRALETVLSDLGGSRSRGYFIQGNYGSGKSHLLVLLSLLLKRPELWQELSVHAGGAPESLMGAGEQLEEDRFLVAGLSLVDHAGSETLEPMVWEAFGRALGPGSLPRRGDVTLVEDLLPVLKRRYGEELESFLEREGESTETSAPRLAPLLEAFMRRQGLPYGARFDRGQTTTALTERMRERGLSGAVLVIDEMSEFLRSKPDARSFSEDVRFLQFLAEKGPEIPLWTVISLQEAIEATGELRTDVLRKIKDRYLPPFVLGQAHIRQLIGQRLVRQKPGARESLEELLGRVDASFPHLGWDQNDFLDIYPIHPGTVEFLESLKVLFSQHRGVVDFIYHRLAGDEARNIAPFLKEEASRFLTPDHIFDHFQDRIRENPETAPFYDRVWAFYQREIPRLLGDETDRDMALRLVKLLVLAAISPVKTRLTARAMTDMLLESISDLDPELNYRQTARLLDHMVREGAYLATESEDSGGETVYYVDLEADVSLLVRNRLENLVKELDLRDSRIWSQLGSEIEDGTLPLSSWLANPDHQFQVSWQRTRRKGRWITQLPSDLGRDGLDRLFQGLDEEDLDLIVLVVPSSHPEEGALLEEFLQQRPEATAVASWLPGFPGQEEGDDLKRALAALILEKQLEGDRSETGRRILEHLQEIKIDLINRVAPVFRRLLSRGVILAGDGQELIRPTAWENLSDSETRARLADLLLSRLHPRHQQVSPLVETVLTEHLHSAWQNLILPGRMNTGRQADRAAERVASGFLVPMKLARRLANEYRIEVDTVGTPLAQYFMELVRESRVEAGQVYSRLRRGPFGLSREAITLLMLVMVSQGLVTAYRDGRRVPPESFSPAQAERVESLGPGESLNERFTSLLASCPLLPPRFKGASSLNLPAQRAIWAHLVEQKPRWIASVERLRDHLGRVKGYRLLQGHDLDAIRADLERVKSVLGEIKTSYSAREGLERLAAAYGESPWFDQAWRRSVGWGRFLSEHLEKALIMHDYLLRAQPEFQDAEEESDPVRFRSEEVEEARTEVLNLLSGEELLIEKDGFDRISRAFDLFRSRYMALYREEHDLQLGPGRFEQIREVAKSSSLRVLESLESIEPLPSASGGEDTIEAVKKALALECRQLTPDGLHRSPLCECGFRIGHQVTVPKASDLWDSTAAALREHLDNLRQARVREALETYVAGLAETGRRKAAQPLLEILELDPADEGATRTMVALMTRPVLRMIEEALEGRTAVVRRDLRDLEHQLSGRVFSQKALTEAITHWITGGEDMDSSVFIKVTGGKGVSRKPEPRVLPTKESDGTSLSERMRTVDLSRDPDLLRREAGPLEAPGEVFHPVLGLEITSGDPARALAALRLGLVDLEAAASQPPETHQEWEDLFIGRVGWMDYLTALLPGLTARRGLDLDEIVPWPDYLRRYAQSRRHLDAAFADFFSMQSHPGFDSSLAGLLSRQSPEENGLLIWADCMRWDLMGHLLQVTKAESPGIEAVDSGCTWAYAPTVTATQLDMMTRQLGTEPVFEPMDPRGPFHSPPRFHRTDLADDRVHSSREDYALFLEECLLAWRRRVLPFLEAAAREGIREVMMVADHGYRINRSYRVREKHSDARYLHGETTPEEVLSPWALILLSPAGSGSPRR